MLAHELWHVRRRDWAWVLLEEAIRAAFWFNPAMWWLISRVQSSREEVVDQLTVQLTNARKVYLEALACLCRSTDPVSRHTLRSPSSPVPPDVADFQGGCDVVQKNCRVEYRHGRRAAGDRSLCLVRASAEGDAHIVGVVRGAEPAARSTSGRSWTGNGPRARAEESDRGEPVELRPVLPARRACRKVAAREARRKARCWRSSARCRTSPSVAGAIAGFYARSGQFDRAVGTLEDAAAANPSNVEGQQMLATFYWEKVFKDQTLSAADKLRYIESGIAATDRALTYRRTMSRRSSTRTSFCA